MSRKLADFFAAVAPFLEGREPHAQAVHALWGDDESKIPKREAARLALYGRFCRIHRFEAVDAVYSATRAAIVRLRTNSIWEDLVEGYFQKHPMHHVEINENGDELAPFIAAQAALAGLPAWVQELAELEWWEWRTLIAANDAKDASASGPLRLATTVELRQFYCDLVGWLDHDADEEGVERPIEPEAGSRVVIFWRNREMKVRRANTSPEELQILKLLHEGSWSKNSALAAALAPTLEDLRAAGIILGNES